MSAFRTRIGFLTALLSFFVVCACLVALPAGSASSKRAKSSEPGGQPGSLRVGVFPVRGFDRESEPFLTSLGAALRTGLGQDRTVEIVPLAWPEDAAETTFETLVSRGREGRCNGVLALRVRALSFTTKAVSVPIVGRTLLAEAEFGLAGGLIDVLSGAAVATIEGESRKRDPRYRGPNPAAALRSEFGARSFDDSLLGAAGADAVRQVVASVQAGLAALTPGPIAGPGPRTRAPQGIGFGQDTFSMSVADGYDHRGLVSVVNRGHKPLSFMIAALDVPDGLVVGLLGEGSTESACTLAPGQWKEVRFIANVPRNARVQAVKLALFSVPAGGTPSLSGTPDDLAMMNLDWGSSPAALTWSVLGQDPVTLAYTCQLKNPTGRDAWNVSIEPLPQHANRAWTSPLIQDVRVPANGTLTFQVVPRLVPGLQAMDVTFEGRRFGRRDFHFAVPKGKTVYMGVGHTGESSSSGGSGCSNQKFINYDTKYVYGSWFKDEFAKALDKGWFWLLKTTGNNQPYQYKGERAGDVRGATVRPGVSARLPNMDTDSVLHPMASAGKDEVGFAFASPGPDKLTGIYFAAERPAANQAWKLDTALQMNEAGHTARWPYLRARWNTSQAYLVWEDARAGRQGDVAFRASGARMKDWKPVQYLTTHGRGVDDPVVQVDDKGSVGVAWNDLRSGSGQIYFRISRDGGATFGPERAVPRSAGESQAWPQFSFGAGAGFKLVYVSKAGAETRVVTRDLDDQGAPLGTTAVLSHPGTSSGEPQVTCERAGRCYAVWREGEGSGSEVWFSRLAVDGSSWTSAKKLTDDSVYSEYPLVWLEGNRLFASYHAEAVSALDVKYLRASDDGGETWGEAVALPSLERDAVSRAFVEVRFSLQNPRASYPPFDTAVFLNDIRVGEIKRAVPEGTYVWEVPVGAVSSTAQGLDGNRISMQFENLNGGHYILAGEARLIARRRYTQVPVVASSQAEADVLANRSGVGLNHSAPDLALATNPDASLPPLLVPGQKVTLRFQVFNLGEATASDATVSLYASDPRGATNPDPDKLAEVRIGPVRPGEVKPVEIGVTYSPARTPRVYAAVSSKEKDHFAADNVSAFSFTKGESDRVPPLFGTDIPDILRAPELMNIVAIPNLGGFADMVSVPGLDRLVGKPGLRPPDLGHISNALEGKLRKAGLPVPDLPSLIKR